MATNKLVTCPYDEAHKVKESRLQVHITKCKRNHLEQNDNKAVCPFNASHIVNKPEMKYHLNVCPDRAPVDRKLSQNLDRNNPYKGRTAVPSYNESAPVIAEELWDSDVLNGGYVPRKQAPVGAIIEPPPDSKPAERKRLYRELHTLPNERDIRPPSAQPVQESPRQPKQPSEASKVEILLQQKVEPFQNLGLGRGRGAPPSRIAANFSTPGANTNSQSPAVRSYSSAASGASLSGLGRGQMNRPGEGPMFGNSDDFPALGLGRGVSNCLRNSGNNAPGPRLPR